MSKRAEEDIGDKIDRWFHKDAKKKEVMQELLEEKHCNYEFKP